MKHIKNALGAKKINGKTDKRNLQPDKSDKARVTGP